MRCTIVVGLRRIGSTEDYCGFLRGSFDTHFDLLRGHISELTCFVRGDTRHPETFRTGICDFLAAENSLADVGPKLFQQI
jgi:hypothetical protein